MEEEPFFKIRDIPSFIDFVEEEYGLNLSWKDKEDYGKSFLF